MVVSFVLAESSTCRRAKQVNIQFNDTRPLKLVLHGSQGTIISEAARLEMTA
jgi:hypothetical protein